jgi:hypothetical protein
LIFKHKPPVNDEYTKAFTGFDTTTINASGETANLTTTFTVAKEQHHPEIARSAAVG